MTRLHSLTKVDAQSYEGCGSLTLRPILLTAKSTTPNNIYRPDNTEHYLGNLSCSWARDGLNTMAIPSLVGGSLRFSIHRNLGSSTSD